MPLSSQIAMVVRQPAVWCLFLCFLIYSAQFLAITAFLPTLLMDKTSLSLRSAGILTAFVLLGNVIGNVLSGVLLSKGVLRHRIVQFAFLSMLILAAVILLDGMQLPLRIGAAVGFTAISGLIPGTLFATAPLLVQKLSLLGIVNGLLLQAAGAGQVLGPILIAGLVDVSGNWGASIIFTSIACLVGITVAGMFARVQTN